MPEYVMDAISKEWLQSELRSPTKSLIVLDCRSTNEYQEGHIRSAVNFSIPSLILKRLAAGKIDLTSTIRCGDLKQRIQSAYTDSLFILYNDTCTTAKSDAQPSMVAASSSSSSSSSSSTNITSSTDRATAIQSDSNSSVETNTNNIDTTTINVLHRRLKQDGCNVYWLKDGFASFRETFPEWCEDDTGNTDNKNVRGASHSEPLMGLRSLRISTPYTDSVCSSSAESSDCESNAYPQHSDAPIEIITGLFLGNSSHSEDLKALQTYNIKYILNVTPDLPNIFEASGAIKYLQIPITDHGSQDLSAYFPTAIKFIDEARQNDAAVLIHCLAGISRSVTVTMAYLMHARLLNFEEAFALVRLRKPDISPNFHFLRQLHAFERKLVDESPSRMTTSQSTRSADSIYSECCECSSPSNAPATYHQHRPYQSLHQQLICQENHYTQIGVSPDSGIEFDRWTSSDSTPK